MEKQFAIVVQAVRQNSLTGRSTLYVLGVKLAKTKDMADRTAEELQRKGFITDVFAAEPLADLV
jgi:hypothetical protein